MTTSPLDPLAFDRDGFAVVADLIDESLRRAALDAFERMAGRAGTRCALATLEIAALANAPRVQELARAAIGPDAACERAILFNKDGAANWRVHWHQDTVIAVSARFDAPGWSAWSEKEGQVCVRPPAAILERRMAIRVDLDGSNIENGGLSVVPGSHRHGVLTPDASRALRDATAAVTPDVPAAGALMIRPLLLHASGRGENNRPRRVVHLEFGAASERH